MPNASANRRLAGQSGGLTPEPLFTLFRQDYEEFRPTKIQKIRFENLEDRIRELVSWESL